MIVLDAIAKALADVIKVKRLGSFFTCFAPLSLFFVSLVGVYLRVSCDFVGVKFCLSEGVHADTTSLVKHVGKGVILQNFENHVAL
jgi:hypothetical protein